MFFAEIGTMTVFNFEVHAELKESNLSWPFSGKHNNHVGCYAEELPTEVS